MVPRLAERTPACWPPAGHATHPRVPDEPGLLPELLLDTTEMALAMASTADSRSAYVFRSDRSASETHGTGVTHSTWKPYSPCSASQSWLCVGL